MQFEPNKAVYRRFIEEGFNQGRLATLDEVLAPGYVNHGAPPGLSAGADGVKQIIALFRAAFPDFRIEIHEQAAEGDLVCSRATFRGTHAGPLFGIAATGRQVTMPGLSMVRVANGQIQEGWIQNDVLGLLQQLGATPLPTPPRS
jgi:predicted ester cyclase